MLAMIENLWSQNARGLRQTKAVAKAAGGRMQAGGSIDSAIAFGSRTALTTNVNASNTATHVIQARMILAVRGHERS